MALAKLRRKPQQQVMIDSGHGSQLNSSGWRGFLKVDKVISTISRQGNRYDYFITERLSRFSKVLKRGRIGERSTHYKAKFEVVFYTTPRCSRGLTEDKIA